MVILKGKSDNLEKGLCELEDKEDFDIKKDIIEKCIECFLSNDKTQCPAKDVLKRFEKTNKMIDGTN